MQQLGKPLGPAAVAAAAAAGAADSCTVAHCLQLTVHTGPELALAAAGMAHTADKPDTDTALAVQAGAVQAAVVAAAVGCTCSALAGVLSIGSHPLLGPLTVPLLLQLLLAHSVMAPSRVLLLLPGQQQPAVHTGSMLAVVLPLWLPADGDTALLPLLQHSWAAARSKEHTQRLQVVLLPQPAAAGIHAAGPTADVAPGCSSEKLLHLAQVSGLPVLLLPLLLQPPWSASHQQALEPAVLLLNAAGSCLAAYQAYGRNPSLDP